MASPRVFISSTCYDLAEVRDTLVDFVMSFGFEAVLSERGDVFYHPDIHTHDSCINEVGNCQLLILIIGGRFGGNYKADPTKSIVNAEYAAARESKVPVFTFVKRNVYSDHFVYQKNRANQTIVYPSIENTSHAAKIFDFIDDVRLSGVNNGFFPFEFARDITDILRKQWAGMFYQFLLDRNNANQFATATNLLKNISVAGEKVEDLLKSLYRHLDNVGAEEKISTVEKRSVIKSFYEDAFTRIGEEELVMNNASVKNLISKISLHTKWYDYIADATGGIVDVIEFGDDQESSDKTIESVVIDYGGWGIVVDKSNSNSTTHINHLKQQERFEILKTSSLEDIIDILNGYDYLKKE